MFAWATQVPRHLLLSALEKKPHITLGMLQTSAMGQVYFWGPPVSPFGASPPTHGDPQQAHTHPKANASQLFISRNFGSQLTLHCCCCLVAKLCPTLCNFMDCSPPGSSIHVISQARILEWVTISYSKGSSWPRIKPMSLALASSSLPLSHLGSLGKSWLLSKYLRNDLKIFPNKLEILPLFRVFSCFSSYSIVTWT